MLQSQNSLRLPVGENFSCRHKLFTNRHVRSVKRSKRKYYLHLSASSKRELLASARIFVKEERLEKSSATTTTRWKTARALVWDKESGFRKKQHISKFKAHTYQQGCGPHLPDLQLLQPPHHLLSQEEANGSQPCLHRKSPLGCPQQ